MPSRLANGLTLLSAVVCVGSAMWVGRSMFVADIVGLPVEKNNGCLGVTIHAQMWLVLDWSTREFFYSSRRAAELGADEEEIWSAAWGIQWLGLGWGSIGKQTFLILPLWLLPLLTAIAPVWWWRKRRRDGGRGFPVEGAAPAE
ncbi:MAG TPA: hypothetical protein VGR35_15505 [Tepidisphaeraceae bacterium]|nr:hypothetical protein [Tepidisphaeraceae bacterium]